MRPVLRRPALDGPGFLDGRQAACCSCAGTGLPSAYRLPASTPGSRWGALSFRNRFSATMRSFQISAVAPSTFLNRLAAEVRSRTAANGLSTTFVVRRCLGGKVEERGHPVPVAGQDLDRLGIGVGVAVREGVASLLGLGPRRSVHDRPQQLLRLRLLALRQTIKDVGHLVVPAPLLPGLRPHLPGRRPDAQVAVGHQQLPWCRPPWPR